ncbi:four-carbon acid sugar kinase family protein [Vibrio quintilis]|uniref:Four-carbon acid sugar kinase family protein n=1 Tax=Vibrio quintilis TaxID=1117707 RepID=A0A1M7YUC0_9VIBR|nr:four-carbon acid sugar kinase family protein [Vibrio quintilis]SHO56239.1 hypothetical protein VQ7734_02008 [Vibrio quintilis]
MKGLDQKPVFIIADDFTGANDIGVAFAHAGLCTEVLFNQVVPPDPDTCADVSVLCTDSRDMASEEAFETTLHVNQIFQLAQCQQTLIKKADSTLRGNIGSELAALLSDGYDLAIMAMAAPEAGRKTTGGICYVNDVPLAETEFATDPKSPVSSSRVLDIVQAQIDSYLVQIDSTLTQIDSTLADIHVYECSGTYSDESSIELSGHFQRLHGLGKRIIICDAESAQDLRCLYLAAEQLPLSCVFVTTGELTPALITPEAPLPALPRSSEPVLAIVGSMSEVTFHQVNTLLTSVPSVCIEPDIGLIVSDQAHRYLNQLAEQVRSALSQGRHCIVRSCGNPQLRYQLDDLSQKYQLDSFLIACRVRDFLAAIPDRVLNHPSEAVSVGSLILCGGDIAVASARQMGRSAFSLHGMFRCMPWGYFTGSRLTCPVLTKAGGFGEESVFLELIQYLHKEV